ncbi:BBE domain-containing protein [Kitasatospora cystarginea]|uniref:BBE domain-containing protein n=1 Tax=Kitasatospora cystarginea TaxID=58350 RepID=A0ABN3DM68_9ACTN
MPASRPIEVGPGDRRYDALRRGFNQRWIAEPEYVVVATRTDDVVAALGDYLAGPELRKRRITVRSGGHCYENFVSSADVGVIIDVSQMSRVYHDPAMKAYCVEAGASNWHSTTHLYRPYGLALPGGSCYSVGLGGHVSGGGYGLLSRLHGLTVDYLHAVEVVTAADGRTPRITVATREPHDPGRELWWAHTGGGGGNFGVITRYWFRDLPAPPSRVLCRSLSWDWDGFRKRPDRFKAMLRRYGAFFEFERERGERDFQGPDFIRDYDYRDMFTLLKLTHMSNGKVGLVVQMDGDRDDSAARLNAFLDWITPEFRTGDASEITEGPLDSEMGEHPAQTALYVPTRLPWLTATQSLNSSGPNRCGKYKSAYMTAGFTEHQIDAIYRNLTDPGYRNPDALLQVDSYGGRVNDVPRDATAVPQRSSVMKLQYQAYWTWGSDVTGDQVRDYQDAQPESENVHLRWIRRFYQDVYSPTNGVPASPGEVFPTSNTDGCYVNYPDVDLSDPAFNPPDKKGHQPWHELYYGRETYRRLQRVKAVWDPYDVFRHAQSIRLPEPDKDSERR